MSAPETRVPEPVDLIVVGAGPAGRALAHRAEQAGLTVTLVDPAPDRPWRATYGMFADDAPAWLDGSTVAARSDTVSVYTPHRRLVPRSYLVLDPEAFRRSLRVTRVIAGSATRIDGGSVTLDDGTVLTAREVVDARGGGGGDPSVPRQTAYGTFDEADRTDDTVLMDWRAAGISALRPASFSYRVPTARGRLTQETCLAGTPPIPISELERRSRLRRQTSGAGDAATGVPAGRDSSGPEETVDFPMVAAVRPWRAEGPLAFGAAGGLMNPATGYSVAQSLGAIDDVLDAVRAGRSPRAALWPRTARIVHLLRVVGLAVLLSLNAAQLVEFFDAFFRSSTRRQRAYLSSRSDPAGLLLSMGAVFVRCPPRLMVAVAIATARAVPQVLRA